MRPAALLFAAALTLSAEDARALMSQVAKNLESASETRRLYVYRQSIKARLNKINGHPARAEDRVYSVFPGPERTEKKLESLRGRYHKSRAEIIEYHEPGWEKGGAGLDGALIEEFIDELVNDADSRDGIPHSMFPFRAADLARYEFTYRERASHRGRPAHRIAFAPATKDGKPWKGEALIDAEDLQPIHIYTDLTARVPRPVRFLLGINLEQTGFSLTYTRAEPGVWFPSSYGAEFRLSLLFRYKRIVTLAIENSGFERATAESTIRFEP